MPAATGAIVLKNALVTIDEVEYANQVRKARFVPTQETQTYKTLVPDGAQSDTDNATWVLELAGLQIWTAGGVADAIDDAAIAGTELEIVCQWKTGAGQPTVTATIKPVRLPMGGEQGQFMEIDVQIPVVGDPVRGVSA
jgi:hypothetical protein